MDKLPKDVVELITNKLTPREFFNYCKSETGQEFCSRKEIWLRRIEKDFGFLIQGINKDIILSDYKIDPKKTYLELFVKTSTAAEKIKNNIIQNIRKDFFATFIRDNYIENLYEFFFTYLLRMLNHIKFYKDFDEIADEVYLYFRDFDDWKNYLPVYNSYISDMWNEEIEDVAWKYAVAIFAPKI